jgi:hypothetical protein
MNKHAHDLKGRFARAVRVAPVHWPGNHARARQRTVLDEQLEPLSPRARAVVLTFLGLLAEMGHARAARIIEAMAMVVAFATPRGRR